MNGIRHIHASYTTHHTPHTICIHHTSYTTITSYLLGVVLEILVDTRNRVHLHIKCCKRRQRACACPYVCPLCNGYEYGYGYGNWNRHGYCVCVH
ncbi:hypothetical protein EON63_07685 [archaeon]|nr:MAG: hypothetical protein EON63_07685 [archaeon]